MSQPVKKPTTAAQPMVAGAKPVTRTLAPAAKAAARGTIPSTRAPAPGSSTGPQERKLKKGELLFAEGEHSRAMYFLKRGMVRIFKQKGDSAIEIDTVHQGQIVGELAFLDGNPRSASGEALTDCELMEISGPTFTAVLGNMPDWLKIMLKTVVGRLRMASTRIRQLETASTAVDYSSKDSKRTYTYITPSDVLKSATALLLVASRNGTPEGTGIVVRAGLLQRYGNQIMQVPVAKITTFVDLLASTGVMTVSDDKYVLNDITFLEQMIAYLNEENLVEPSKRHDVSVKGFLVMSLIAKHLAKYPKDEKTGVVIVNVAEIQKLEPNSNGKPMFGNEDFEELVKLGYTSTVTIKSNDAAFCSLKHDTFMQAYRMQRIVMAVHTVNEQKRKAPGAK